MNVITRKQLARDAAKRWRSQYPDLSPEPMKSFSFITRETTTRKPSLTVYQELLALGDSPTPEHVNGVIGNTSWTELQCDECKQEVEAVTHVGDTFLCRSCVEKALNQNWEP